MSYETASATSADDLLDKLRIFSIAAGWAVDFWGNRSDSLGKALLMSKSGICVAFLSNNPSASIDTYTYPGPYSSSQNPQDQTNKTTTTYSNNIGAPFTAYHFFTDPANTYIHVVLEVVPGRFSHFGAGALDKQGGGTPVAYNYGLAWNYNPSFINQPNSYSHYVPWDESGGPSTAFRVDSDGVSPRNQIIGTGGIDCRGGWRVLGNACLASMLLQSVYSSTLTGRSMLIPLIVMSARTSGVYSVLGTPFDKRLISLELLAPGELITIGSDQWKVFPVIRKNGPTGVENSGLQGYAYRIVP